jgi:hypothetical protein
MSKIDNLLASLAARYGKFTPKDGQLVDAVIQSWEAAVGLYDERDLRAACASWMSSTKFARWPEPAELIEILRSFGARPVTMQVQMEPRTQQAANDAGRWYNQLVVSALPSGAWPWRWDDAVQHVINPDGSHKGKSFAWMLTHAWLRGEIPSGFDAKARAFFADQVLRKQRYLDAVKANGPARVHLGKVNLPA